VPGRPDTVTPVPVPRPAGAAVPVPDARGPAETGTGPRPPICRNRGPRSRAVPVPIDSPLAICLTQGRIGTLPRPRFGTIGGSAGAPRRALAEAGHWQWGDLLSQLEVRPITGPARGSLLQEARPRAQQGPAPGPGSESGPTRSLSQARRYLEARTRAGPAAALIQLEAAPGRARRS
jgi:hypothetical protein